MITRPLAENGLGCTTEQAVAEIDNLARLFALLPEVSLMQEWQWLVTKYRVSGKNTHDARLVAAMLVHGVANLLTFNPRDFARYSEIVVIDAITFA